ncbi:MAG TPA: ferrous iron transport protein A [Desulfocapsa sulfexigens]|nr:ferrous iron transport protein A [Desulfocapsa sulfexigens]HIQ37557.1 ferrous iron transport protein A [Desulfocapsa sulfexigens]
MERTLVDISVGTTGRIAGFGKGKKEYRKKLLAMGLIKGTEFTVSRVAPMGDPVEIKIRGYNLSLRKDEAAIVAVEEV